MEKTSTCCFSGHRKLPKEKIEGILKRLNHEVDNLINRGVTNFIMGGMPGFEQIAASLIVAKKELGCDIRLIFVLSYEDQDESWASFQKNLYQNLLQEADEIICVSKKYEEGCVKKRNRFMTEHSAYCICARLYPSGQTDKVLQYARQEGVKVINIAD